MPPPSVAPAWCRCATWGCTRAFNAFLILQGIETLALRMDRINANTLRVAQFLEQHAKVAWVSFAALPMHRPRPGTEVPGRQGSGLGSPLVREGRARRAAPPVHASWMG